MGSSEFDSGAAVDGAACKAASMASKAEEEDGGDDSSGFRAGTAYF